MNPAQGWGTCPKNMEKEGSRSEPLESQALRPQDTSLTPSPGRRTFVTPARPQGQARAADTGMSQQGHVDWLWGHHTTEAHLQR